jgi:hypothetical protein
MAKEKRDEKFQFWQNLTVTAFMLGHLQYNKSIGGVFS